MEVQWLLLSNRKRSDLLLFQIMENIITITIGGFHSQLVDVDGLLVVGFHVTIEVEVVGEGVQSVQGFCVVGEVVQSVHGLCVVVVVCWVGLIAIVVVVWPVCSVPQVQSQ